MVGFKMLFAAVIGLGVAAVVSVSKWTNLNLEDNPPSEEETPPSDSSEDTPPSEETPFSEEEETPQAEAPKPETAGQQDEDPAQDATSELQTRAQRTLPGRKRPADAPASPEPPIKKSKTVRFDLRKNKVYLPKTPFESDDSDTDGEKTVALRVKKRRKKY